QLQRVYGPTTVTAGILGSFDYFGAPYPAGTTFYDNIDGFLRTGGTVNQTLAFSGASADNRVNYRLGTAVDKQNGVVPNSGYSRVNVTAASQAQIARWLRSEEHTSELQSRFDLVCRLLLEKKKKKKKQHPI